MVSSDIRRMTSGRIVPQLIRFALPFLGANLLISLYGAADVFIVSYFADSATLSATATGAQAVFTLMAIAMGLTLGGSILIGQYFGAHREKDVLETIGTLFLLISGIGLGCSLLMILGAKAITDWLQTPTEAKEGAYHYILICGGGIVFSFIYDAVSAVLRGLGDSKNPLKFIAIACLTNIMLDLIFIGYFHWGAGGAAAATVIAQSISVIIGVIYLKHRNFIFDFKLKSFSFVPQKAKTILKLGIPTAIQQTIVFASFTVMVYAVNQLGVIESAVLGITNRIDGFLIMPALAIASAISVMVAQNMGAGEIERAKESFFIGFLLSLIFSFPAFVIMYQYPDMLMDIVTDDPVMIMAGGLFMQAYSPDCLLLALVFSTNGFFNGCGRTTFTMVNNGTSSLVFRVPLILIARNLYEVGLAMPLATIPQLIFAVSYFGTGRWKKALLDTNKEKTIPAYES